MVFWAWVWKQKLLIMFFKAPSESFYSFPWWILIGLNFLAGNQLLWPSVSQGRVYDGDVQKKTFPFFPLWWRFWAQTWKQKLFSMFWYFPWSHLILSIIGFYPFLFLYIFIQLVFKIYKKNMLKNVFPAFDFRSFFSHFCFQYWDIFS